MILQCVDNYLSTQIKDGRTKDIKCPTMACEHMITYEEVCERIRGEGETGGEMRGEGDRGLEREG